MKKVYTVTFKNDKGYIKTVYFDAVDKTEIQQIMKLNFPHVKEYDVK